MVWVRARSLCSYVVPNLFSERTPTKPVITLIARRAMNLQVKDHVFVVALGELHLIRDKEISHAWRFRVRVTASYLRDFWP